MHVKKIRGVAILTGVVLVGGALATAVPAAATTTPDATITVSDLIRSADQALQLGFNTPWSAIQGVDWKSGSGIWDPVTRTVDAAVRDELRQTPGLSFRYPGGNPSNHFKWMQTVGPVASRVPQYDPDIKVSMPPTFGFDEFMAMVEDVEGVATITVNMSDFSANAAAWVEYANAPNDGSNSNGGVDWAARRAANGHPAPYGITRWELDNERDLRSHGQWTVETYIAKAEEFIPKMLAADPTIEIVAHARTAPWDTPDWAAWHTALITQIGDQIDGIAFHPYYDGLDVPTVQSYVEQIRDDAAALGHPELDIALTEHAQWPADVEVRTTWARTTSLSGAISTTDMLIATEQDPVVAEAYWHALSGLGPWQLYSPWDAAVGDYGTTFTVRPVAEALTMFADARAGEATVLRTEVTGPNTSGYTGGYDISASASVSEDGSELVVVAANRGNAHAASLDLGARVAAGTSSTVSVLDPSSGEQPAVQSTSTVTNAVDAAGDLVLALPAQSVTVHRIPLDTVAPTVTVKAGAAETVGADGVYSRVSFKLYDAGRIDRVALNGVVKDLVDNTWSDLNFVKPGVFGAVSGENTLVVYDVAGNVTTLSFVLG